MKEHYARYDTESNAIDNLNKAAHFLRTVRDNTEDWKWVVVCIYSSLYRFAIQVAKGSDDRSVVKTTKKGNDRLITFDEALDICKVSSGGRTALVISSDEEKAINRIQKDFRHNFEHFNPGSWSIEVSGFPMLTKNVLSVLRRLALTHNLYTHIEEQNRINLEFTLDECDFLLNKLEAYYA